MALEGEKAVDAMRFPLLATLKGARLKRLTGDQALFVGLIFPTVAILVAFVAYPAVRSLYLSFHDVEPFSQTLSWAGLDNFKALFSSPEFLASLLVTFHFSVLTVLPSVVISLVLALLLDANPYFQNIWRTLFLLPVAISSAMAAMLWIFLFNPTAGYLNYLLECLGVHGPNWLADPNWALYSVALVTVWKELGFNVIFFLAGLSGIPKDVNEAAYIDGAKPLRRIISITLPLLSPTILFVTIVSLINSFQTFGQIHILTGGGPAGTTTTLVYQLYQDAFTNFRTGFASAQAVVLFAILLVATYLQFRAAKSRVHYG